MAPHKFFMKQIIFGGIFVFILVRGALYSVLQRKQHWKKTALQRPHTKEIDVKVLFAPSYFIQTRLNAFFRFSSGAPCCSHKDRPVIFFLHKITSLYHCIRFLFWTAFSFLQKAYTQALLLSVQFVIVHHSMRRAYFPLENTLCASPLSDRLGCVFPVKARASE